MKDVGTTLCTACGKVRPIMLFTSLHTWQTCKNKIMLVHF